MNFEHVSVMLMPTVDMLDVREGGVYVDGTLGGGGHSAEILRRLNGTGHLYGIDRDNDALAAALGLPRLSIEKFETGRQTPSQEQQQKLAGAFGVSLPYLRGETDDPTSMDNWLSGAVPQEDVVLPKAVRKATAAVVAQSGDSGRSDGAVFSALLKSDSFKALVRETVLDVLKSPEGQALLAKAAKK